MFGAKLYTPKKSEGVLLKEIIRYLTVLYGTAFSPRHCTSMLSIPKRNLHSLSFPCSSNKILEMGVSFDGTANPNC